MKHPRQFEKSVTKIRCGLLLSVLLLAAMLPVACSQPKPRVHDTAWVIDDAFRDNTRTYEVRTEDEAAVLEVLRGIKTAYETGNVEALEASLDTDFENLYRVDASTAKIDRRLAFLKSISWWVSSDRSDRELVYSVRGIAVDSAGTKAFSAALSALRSKYFAPRFVETFLLHKVRGTWKLRRRVVTLLYPGRLESLRAEIIVSPRPRAAAGDSVVSELASIMNQGGPDSFVRRFRPELTGIPGNETPHSVLFVFREPPPPGTEVIVEHQFWRPWAQNLSPYRFSYGVENPNPFFIIENITQAGGRGGRITYRVRANGVLVGEKTVDIQ